MATATCASCGSSASSAASVTLSRCSQCKWVSYCSKPCQMRHWKHGSHRQQCGTLRKVAAFRDAEERFWSTRSSAELAEFRAYEGLDPDSMRFFGEVLFVLSGLKPGLLFSNLPSQWRVAFIQEVIVASGVLVEPFPSVCAPSLFVIGSNVQTPAEYELGGTLVLLNTAHAACASIEPTLRLHAVQTLRVPITLPTLEPSQAVHLVQEAKLAQFLDYPVALDECGEPMIEVGYFLASANGATQLLLSYCASTTTTHSERIRSHFHRYQQHFDHATLPLIIRSSMLS